MAVFALMNGTPYIHGRPSPKQVNAEIKKEQAVNPDLRAAKCLVTTASKQNSATLKQFNAWLDSLEACMKEHPDLRYALMNVIAFDEVVTNTHGEHASSTKCVYDRALRRDNGGAARSAAPASGSNRMTGCVTIAANGFVPPVGTYVKGTYLQERWFAKPYPFGVTEEDVRDMVCIPTPAGVATTESHLQMFERQCLIPCNNQRFHDKSVPLVIIVDACGQHGVDNQFADIKPAMAALLKKYNATLMVVPSNCSQHCNPLDLLFLGNWKNLQNRTTGHIVNVRHMRDQWLNPSTLELEHVSLGFPDLDLDDESKYPTAFTRAQNCEPSLSPRTLHMVMLLMIKAKGRELANAAVASFRSHGIWPPNRALYLKKAGLGVKGKGEKKAKLLAGRSARMEELAQAKAALEKVIVIAQRAVEAGLLSATKEAADAIVTLCRKEVVTAGGYIDTKKSKPNQAGGPDKVAGQRTIKGMQFWSLGRMQDALAAEKTNKQKAKEEKKRADKEEKAKQKLREKQKTARTAALEATKAATAKAAKASAAAAVKDAKSAASKAKAAKEKQDKADLVLKVKNLEKELAAEKGSKRKTTANVEEGGRKRRKMLGSGKE